MTSIMKILSAMLSYVIIKQTKRSDVNCLFGSSRTIEFRNIKAIVPLSWHKLLKYFEVIIFRGFYVARKLSEYLTSLK